MSLKFTLSVEEREQPERILRVEMDVIGTPASKGSNRAMLIAGRARFVPGGSKKNQAQQKSWANEVSCAAQEALGGMAPFAGVPLEIAIEFRLVRPQGHYGKRGLKTSAPSAPHVKPDLDKLVRATLDPLEGVLFDGDSRVVELRARKVYAELGTLPGAHIVVALHMPPSTRRGQP